MLDFSKIRLSSFKSFVDPVEIDIGKGLTGVVGPNGCGKSNLVEALSWVMGEASYKSMRAPNMDGVIFSGTQNRPARNSAEVTLVMNNKERDAPQICNNSDTIEITRRIERESGSIYKVNGMDTRARDIQMIFADVATGARSPSLVKQGQIQELIDQKPEERRRILEDAAGISGLHVRRHEAELRINSAEANLDRLDDVLKELASQMRSLNKQSREANRYKSLSEKIRETEVNLLALRYKMVSNENNKSLEELKKIKEKHENLVGRITNKKTEELKLQDQIPKLKDEANNLSSKLQRLTIELEGLHEDFSRSEKRKNELISLITTSKLQLKREEQIINDLEGKNINEKNSLLENLDKDELEKELSKLLGILKENEKSYNLITELLAERQALEKLIGEQLNNDNTLINELSVNEGYEEALDALLGDELYHSIEENSPIHWIEMDKIKEENPLPLGILPLSDFVKGSNVLLRRLDQTGLVEKHIGAKLMHKLKYGQRLVSIEGDLWRWDGLVVSAGAPGSAAERLAQRNRLTSLHDEIKIFYSDLGSLEDLRLRNNEIQQEISILRLNIERYEINKNSSLDVEKRIKEAKEQIEKQNDQMVGFRNELDKFGNLPEESEEKKIEITDRINNAQKESFLASDILAKVENNLREISSDIRKLSEDESMLRESKGRIESTCEANNLRLQEIKDQISKELKTNVEELLVATDLEGEFNLEKEQEIITTLDRYKNEREELGGVNLRAEQEASEIKERIDKMKAEKKDLEDAIKKLKGGIQDLNKEGRQRMLKAFDQVNKKFQTVFNNFFGGGQAELKFIDSDDPLEAGLEVLAQLPGKKLISMSSLSGGEKALTALSLIFAVFLTNPSPICVLDEVDAPLDDANVERFCNLIQEISSTVNTRFLIITHHPLTMARMDRLFGITMQEKGVSQLVSVDLNAAEKIRKIA
jgi:chromosome segregation protein